MKRFLLLCLMLMILTTGCTNVYKTVEEYSDAMSEVRAKTPAYTLKVKHTLPGQELYSKSYIKGNKWKTVVSANGSTAIMLCDGINLYSYVEGFPYAVKVPNNSSNSDPEMMFNLNPVSLLFNWEKGYSRLPLLKGEAQFINSRANKNGFICRMIKFDSREACVSDKYGIAAYHNIKNIDNSFLILDLISIDTTQISDSEFKLPSNVKVKY